MGTIPLRPKHSKNLDMEGKCSKRQRDGRRSGSVAFGAVEATELTAGRFMAGTNVRRHEVERDVWVSAGMPATVRADGWLPWGVTVLRGTSGKQAVWFVRGNSLAVNVAEAGAEVNPAAIVTALGTLNGTPVAVEAVEEGTLRIVVEGARAVYATYTRQGAVTLHGEMPQLPQLRLEATSGRAVTVAVGRVALSGDSDAMGATLADADVQKVTVALMAAYGRQKSLVAGMGGFMQPVVARWRLLDGRGSTVAMGAPVLLGQKEGVQCSGEVTMPAEGSDLGALAAGSLSARSFNISLGGMRAIPAPWSRIVRRAVVEISDIIDPVAAESQALCRVANDGHGPTVYARLPIAGEAMLRSKVTAALMGDGFRVHAAVDEPFGENASTEVSVGNRPLWTDLRAPRLPWSHQMRDAVSYAMVTRAGERAVAAGRSEEVFAGYGVQDYAITTSEGAWRAQAEMLLVYPDGSERRRVSVSSGTGHAPQLVSGLIVVPDVNARRLRLTVSTGGKILAADYDLQPIPEAACACCLQPGLKGTFPDKELAAMPAVDDWEEQGMRRTEPGYVGIFDSDALAVELARTSMPGKVVYAGMMPRNNGAWDFSRLRLLLMGTFGTYRATVDAQGAFHTMSPMDLRPVASRQAVCEAPGDKGLTLYAVAGGDLVEAGSGAVATLLPHCGAVTAGWCGRYGELWLAGAEGQVRRLSPSFPQEIVDVRLPGLSGGVQFSQNGAGLLMAAGDSGLILDPSEESYAALPVALRLRYRNPWPGGDARRLHTLVVPVTAASFAGSIALFGDRSTAAPCELCTLRVDGAVNAPVPLTPLAPWRPWLEVCITADAARSLIYR